MGKADLVVAAVSSGSILIGMLFGFGRGAEPDMTDPPAAVTIQIQQRALSEAVAKQAVEIEALKQALEGTKK